MRKVDDWRSKSLNDIVFFFFFFVFIIIGIILLSILYSLLSILCYL